MSESPRTPDTQTVTIKTSDSESANQKLAEAASDLGDDVESNLNSRGEERFAWLMVCIILFDCFVFTHMPSWTGPIVIGILQVILVIALARKLRVEEIGRMLSRFMDRVGEYPDNKR